MAQEIGLSAKFDTRQFSRGLNVYVQGLQRAEQATQATAAAINAAALQIGQAWQQASAAPSVALLALQSLTNSIATLGNVVRNMSGTLQTFTGAFGAMALAANQVAGNMGNVSQQVQRANRSVKNMHDQLRRSTVATIGLAVAISGTLILAFRRLGQTISSTVSEGIELVRFFERSQLAIQFFAARSERAADSTLTFNQAMDAASVTSQGLLIWLQKLAIASPFTSKDVVQAFRVAQAYGLTLEQAQQLVPLLLDLGAATGLDPGTLENAARALGQIQARGKLTGEEIRQLGNAGIPIRDILVKELGIANNEFDKLLEAGAIGADITIPALTKSMEEFRGAGEKVAFETIGGLISAFEELKQVATARFFEGVFEPLREGLLSIVETANDLETIALFRVLGEEVGLFIRNGVERLIKGIRGMIDAWQSLAPQTRQNILLFATAGVLVTGLAIALGALFLALRLIIRPSTLIIAAFAAANVAWQRLAVGFQEGIKNITSGFNKLLSDVTGAVNSLVSNIGQAFSEVADIFADVLSSLADFGSAAAEVFASGFSGATKVVENAFLGIAELFSYWFAPGSPPRVAPDIDQWGIDTIAVYADGLSKGAKAVTGPVTAIGSELLQNFRELEVEASEEARLIGEGIGNSVWDGWMATSDNRPPALQNRINKELKRVADETRRNAAYFGEAGKESAGLFWEGFLEEFPKPVPRVNQELQEILSKIGGGTQLRVSGALAIESFLEGFEKGDFGALDDIVGVISSRLSSLEKIGDIGDIDVPRILFQTREEVTEAIASFREFGQVGELTFKSLRNIAGPAGEAVSNYLRKYFEFATASGRATAAQDELNQTVEYYKNLIEPIRRQLEALQEQTTQFSEQREIVRLTRVAENFANSQLRREEARAKIAQIQTQQRLRSLEGERDAAVTSGEERVESEEKIRDEIKEQLGLISARLELQNKQLAEVANEADIISKLREQAEKLAEKQLSELELQLKFAKLLREEESDRLEEARARYVLNQADSTEFEKQQALLKLQTIELNRQRREAEAIELGFDPALFQPIRDAVITLDDLNIKTKDAKLSADDLFDTLGTGGINAEALTKEWEDALDNVRKKYQEIKDQFLDTLKTINDGLPTFLKLFPEEEGETPPIIKNLTRMAIGIGVVQSVMAATRIIELLAALRSGLLAASSSALVTRVVTAMSTIGTSFIGLATNPITILIAAIAALAVAWFTNFANIRTFSAQWGANILETILTVAEGVLNLVKIIDTVRKGIFTEEGRQAAREEILALRQELSTDEGVADLLKGSYQQGLDFATEFVNGIRGGENPALAFYSAFNEKLNDANNGFDTDSFTKQFVDDLDEAAAGWYDDIAETLVGPIASNTELDTRIEEATAALGVNIADGIAEGVDKANIAQEQWDSFIEQQIQKLEQSAGIDSPSTLFAERIGGPIAEGIVAGIEEFFKENNATSSVEAVFSNIEEVATNTNKTIIDGARQFNTLFTIRMNELKVTVSSAWETVTTNTAESWESVKKSIFDSIAELNEEVPIALSALSTAIVSVFTGMKTAAVTEVNNMATEVIGRISTDDDSMIKTIQSTLLGTTTGGTPTQDSVAYKLGVDFVSGIASGINDPVTWTSTIKPAIEQFMTNWRTEWALQLETGSPSKLAAREIGVPWIQGIAMGINAGSPMLGRAVQDALTNNVNRIVGSPYDVSPASATGSIVNNNYRSYNYNLSVNSNVSSQNVINDFAIMRVLAG